MIPIYIEFTKPNKKFAPLSYIIRKVENTTYSHVRIRWTSFSGGELIFEAAGTNVRLLGQHAKPKTSVVKSYQIMAKKEDYKKLISLFKYAGVSYGFLQLIGFSLTYLPFFDKNPFSDGRYTQVCSELVAILLELLGYEVGEDLDQAKPKHIELALIKYCKQHNNVKRVI